MLGGPSIYIKRDDLLGLVGSGNKTRKLEFLVADALAKNADTLITCGGVQSNHCRLTLAAANQEGLQCRLVLSEQSPGSFERERGGNAFLYRLLGVEQVVTIPSSQNYDEALVRAAAEVRSAGRIPYVIPLGGSTPVGATGYVSCALEILQQTFEMGLAIDYVVCPSASAGTHAGLVVGFCGTNSQVSVLGINVMRRQSEQVCAVYELAQATAAHLGLKQAIPQQVVQCFDEYLGAGYAEPTKEMAESVRLLARREGILLDPVYTGKAMAGLIDLVRRGFFKKDDNVLFVHTGGVPGIYANPEILLK
jgi:D-cysteine desulfhydrase